MNRRASLKCIAAATCIPFIPQPVEQCYVGESGDIMMWDRALPADQMKLLADHGYRRSTKTYEELINEAVVL